MNEDKEDNEKEELSLSAFNTREIFIRLVKLSILVQIIFIFILIEM